MSACFLPHSVVSQALRSHWSLETKPPPPGNEEPRPEGGAPSRLESPSCLSLSSGAPLAPKRMRGAFRFVALSQEEGAGPPPWLELCRSWGLGRPCRHPRGGKKENRARSQLCGNPGQGDGQPQSKCTKKELSSTHNHQLENRWGKGPSPSRKTSQSHPLSAAAQPSHYSQKLNKRSAGGRRWRGGGANGYFSARILPIDQ